MQGFEHQQKREEGFNVGATVSESGSKTLLWLLGEQWLVEVKGDSRGTS